MGLDMYLSAEKYVGGWNHSKDEEKARFNQILETVEMKDVVTMESPGIHVRVNVAYWRKANAIHAWFVRELANGVDECQPICVSREKLQELVDLCKRAISHYKDGDVEAAGRLLAPQAGFFFGDTEVNDYWLEDLEHTVEVCEPLLKVEGVDFQYQASW
jgi:hypothetical protein